MDLPEDQYKEKHAKECGTHFYILKRTTLVSQADIVSWNKKENLQKLNEKF